MHLKPAFVVVPICNVTSQSWLAIADVALAPPPPIRSGNGCGDASALDGTPFASWPLLLRLQQQCPRVTRCGLRANRVDLGSLLMYIHSEEPWYLHSVENRNKGAGFLLFSVVENRFEVGRVAPRSCVAGGANAGPKGSN